MDYEKEFLTASVPALVYEDPLLPSYLFSKGAIGTGSGTGHEDLGIGLFRWIL